MTAHGGSDTAVLDIAERVSLRFDELELAKLPASLQRNSLDYYYLSVWPGLLQLEPFADATAPPQSAPIRSGYIHLPFCSGLCDFCSYFVVVSRDPDRDDRLTDYVDQLLLEMDLMQGTADVELSYLYLGGGTPSILVPEQMKRLLNGLRARGALSPELLGTVELHPELFTDTRRADAFLSVLLEQGITRVSIGLQSADDALLHATNRRHRSDFVGPAVERLHDLGLTVNLDLMYGLANQSVESWIGSLRVALQMSPESISTYFMFLDPGTALRRDVLRGAVRLPVHRVIQTQHLAAQMILEDAGLFELPGDFWCAPSGDPGTFEQQWLPSEANSLGLGAGAYGYYSGVQYFNQFDLRAYRTMLSEDRLPRWRGAVLSPSQQRCRDIMFSLKNSPYLDTGRYEARHGVGALGAYDEVFGLLTDLDLVRSAATNLRLTSKGRLLVEEIACLFEPAGHHVPRAAHGTHRLTLAKHNFAPLYSASRSSGN